MKVAISAQGQDLSAIFHSGFGRAPGFIIYDLVTDEFSFLSNQHNLAGAKGVGARTAQDVANSGVQAVITGQAGPKAFAFLRGQKIDIYLTDKGTVQEAVQAFKDGELQARDSLINS